MKKLLWFLFAIAGIGLILFGLLRKETEEILRNAVLLCLSCIGIQ